MNHFKTLKELEKVFKTNDDCLTYFEQIRWADGITCPHCGSTKYYTLAKAHNFKCANKHCYKKFNVLKNTIFENTKIPLPAWFTAIYIASSHKKGISSVQLAKDVGIIQRSSWFVMHRIREMFREDNVIQFKGEIEADETYVGGKAENKHRSKRVKGAQGRSMKVKTPVMGIIERGGRIVTFPVTSLSSAAIIPVLTKYVTPDSTIYSDEWSGYKDVHRSFHHEVIKHKKDEFVRGRAHTNTIEGYWSLLKRGIYGIYHQTSSKHLHRYCVEFSFRYNTRKLTEEERFIEALKMAYEKRLKYQDLIKKA